MKTTKYFNMLRRHIEPILKDSNNKNGSPLVRFFLILLSYVYGSVVKVRYYMFEKKIFSSKKVPCKTIAVGNLTVGGTGKTPFVVYLAKLMRRFGISVVIASRGYGSNMERVGCVVGDGVSHLKNVFNAGDEPYLITKLLKKVPVIIGKNKFEVGMKAVRIFDPDVIIYDDAFQHIGVKYDLNLVLMDSKSPLGNGFMLPRGILRGPISALRRADALIFTRNSGKRPHLGYNNSLPKFSCSHRLILRTIIGGGLYDSESNHVCRNRNIVAFSGIANNSEFYEELIQLGFSLRGKISFEDHHKYNPEDIEKILILLKQTKTRFIATTDKDYVKLENRFFFPVPLLVFGVDINFTSFESESRFINFILNFISTQM